MSKDPDSLPSTAAIAAVSSDALTEANVHSIPPILPHGRVFPIQIGDELFKLSGASLCSDAPSYFSHYFRRQIDEARARGDGELACANVKTLYIDRDPATFRDIARHLQGYHVKPKDATHFVRLFADAHFYSLPKFISQLYDENIFLTIGGREFQIPRNVFSDPGNHPNFFSLGFAIFFSRPDDLFPGLPREGLLRPPSIEPPAVPNRDPDTFSDLLRMLRGYPLRVRDEAHREDLLRDAKYFHFKGLEQRIIAHEISYNQARGREEIALRLENVQKSGVSVERDDDDDDDDAQGAGKAAQAPTAGWVQYARPFVDERPREMVLEVGNSATRLHFGSEPRAEFFRETRTRITRLLEVIAAKLNLPTTTQPLGPLVASGGAASQPAAPGNTPLSDERVRVVMEPESAITLDGRPWHRHQTQTRDFGGGDAGADNGEHPRKRQRVEEENDQGSPAVLPPPASAWIVKKGLWRLRIRPSGGGKTTHECVLIAVKLDAESCEQARNSARGFL